MCILKFLLNGVKLQLNKVNILFTIVNIGGEMKLIEAISVIQLKTKKRVRNSDIALKLGVKRSYITEVERKELTQSFVERLEAAYGVMLNHNTIGNTLDGSFEVNYWDGVKDFEYLKRTDITSMCEDKNFIRSLNKECDNICMIRIFNKKMDGGTYPYCENDIAYIDLGDTDCSDGGVYLFTTKTGGKKHIFVAQLNPNIDGDIVITYRNAVTLQKTRTPAQLKEVNFKIIGRVFYNKTRTGQTIS